MRPTRCYRGWRPPVEASSLEEPTVGEMCEILRLDPGDFEAGKVESGGFNRSSLQTTNAIERIFGEFPRRVKTQGALPGPEAILTVLWGTLATGGIRLRKLDGYQTMTTTALRQAA